MDKKYQVFISSTYLDLKEERAAVTEAILRLEQIPIGMEAFNAGDEAQWEIIKRAIDNSDYYIVIIGNRYGSITPDGISYTEKEYRYALSKAIPVSAFIIQGGAPSGEDLKTQLKLQEFKDLAISKSYDFWTDKKDLAYKVSTSLHGEMNRTPRIGWIRANTLMDTEDLNAFCEKDKRKLLASTIDSIVSDSEVSQMMKKQINEHLDCAKNLQLRTAFKYSFRLLSSLPNGFRKLPGVDANRYYRLQEILDYTVLTQPGTHSQFNTNKVKVGFSFDKTSLDKGLLAKASESEYASCIFNEYLDISRNAIQALRNSNPDELRSLLLNVFSLVIKIDNKNGRFDSATCDSSGIIVTFDVDFDTAKTKHDVKVAFKMPKPWGSVFEATLVDPTANPEIRLTYESDKMDVEMYSFLNRGAETNYDAREPINGLFDISVSDEWIYPKSGVVFFVKKKRQTATISSCGAK